MGGINVRPPGWVEGLAGARRVGLSVGVARRGWWWRGVGGLFAHQFEESSKHTYSLPKLSE